MDTHFTSRIDAAIKLFPKGWYARVQPRFHSIYSWREKQEVRYDAMGIKPNWAKATPVDDADWFDVVEVTDFALPAAAVAAAALKAIKIEEGRD